MKRFKVTILGSGTSQGIPLIGCPCEVCQSTDSKDKRLRSSILIQWDNQNFVVDSGPDFRYQMLRENVTSLRAIIYTHEHKDHVAGMDDVRAFNYIEKRDMELFANEGTAHALKRDFYYAFAENPYPGSPRVNLHVINNAPFELPDGPEVLPILGYHFKLPVFGFRIQDFAYFTDVKTIPDEEMRKLENLDVLILDCLKKEPHISHLNLEEALEVIERVKPKKTYLTHISHQFGRDEEINKLLPPNVYTAYDGLSIEL